MGRIIATLAVVGALLFSAGSTLADFDDDTASANELFVEAVKLVNSSENVEGLKEKAAVLEEAFSKLNEIVDDYPSSELAVKLISGQRIGAISLEIIGKVAETIREKAKNAAVAAREEAERAREEEEWVREFDKTLKAAERGDAGAQYDLGYRYYFGKEFVSQDYAEALKWFRKAAEQDYGKAQFSLGFLHEHGHGVSESDAEAFKWYRKAAEQGYADAQYNLGNMYDKGRGVPEDKAEALKWWSKAAEQGHEDANEWLEFLEAK